MRYTVRNQEALLELTYNINKDRLNQSYTEFKKTCPPHKYIGLIKNNVCIGTIAISTGNLVHISIEPKYRKYWAGKWIKEFLDKDTFYTITKEDDEYRSSFAQRIGFKEINRQHGIIIFKREI